MNKLKSLLPPKLKLISILTLSFVCAITVLVFNPLDLFLHNPTGFLVSWTFFLPSLIVSALFIFAMLMIIIILLWNRKTWIGILLIVLANIPFIYFRLVHSSFMNLSKYLLIASPILIVIWILLTKLLKQRAVDCVVLILWGGFVVAYVQYLFLNGEMTLVTGDIAPYSALTLGHILNALLWVFITLAPLLIWMDYQRTGKEFKYEKPLITTALIICCMQITGLVSTASTAELPEGIENETRFLSYSPVMNYGTNDNICVFLLDRLDVQYMSEVLEDYPELCDQLDGFTFYKNNIAEFAVTFPSVPKMLTEHYYTEGLTFSEYWQEAWSQKTPIDTLRENGYSTNLLIDKISTYGSFEQIEDRTDNIMICNIEPNHKGIISISLKLSLSRLSPYLLKNLFLNGLDAGFGNQFFINTNSSYQEHVIGADSDLDFYNYVTSSSITTDPQKPVFSFIHMNCSHVSPDKNIRTHGYHHDAETKTIVSKGNYIETTRACFEILSIYFNKLKEAGVYDNTTIIILGDHGRVFDLKDASPVTTSLLIKPQNARGSLKTDTTTELSNKYLGASILESANIPHEDLGISYFDIINGEPAPMRRFFRYTSWWGERYKSETISLHAIYEISGDANKWENWKSISLENTQ